MMHRTPTRSVWRVTNIATILLSLLVFGPVVFTVNAQSAGAPGSTSPVVATPPGVNIVPGGVTLGSTAGLPESAFVPAGNVTLRESTPANENEKSNGEWLI